MFNKLISREMVLELLLYYITISFIIYIFIQIYKKDKSKTIILTLTVLTLITFIINELILLDRLKNIFINKNIFETIFCTFNKFIHHYVITFLTFSLFLYNFKDIIMYYVLGVIMYFTTQFILKNKKSNCIFFTLDKNINCKDNEKFYTIHDLINYLLNNKKKDYNIQKTILLIVFIYKLYTERKIIYKLYIEKKFINFYNGK